MPGTSRRFPAHRTTTSTPWAPAGVAPRAARSASPANATPVLSRVLAALVTDGHRPRVRRPAALALAGVLVIATMLGATVASFADPQQTTIVLPLLPALTLPLGFGAPAAPPAAPAPAAAPVPPPTPPTVDGVPSSSLVADATVPSVPIYASPNGPVVNHVPGQNSVGQAEAFLVTDQSTPGWYQVELPVKPTNSTGWISARDVTTRTDPYFIRVSQSNYTLQLFNAGQLRSTFPVAVGLPSTPTPNGNFFVWASQSYNAAPYAAGIFALSTFSPVLVNWPGGGRTGIHGWQDTSVLGRRASNGCVRMSGADFAQLLNTVPLGTPVQING